MVISPRPMVGARPCAPSKDADGGTSNLRSNLSGEASGPTGTETLAGQAPHITSRRLNRSGYEAGWSLVGWSAVCPVPAGVLAATAGVRLPT